MKKELFILIALLLGVSFKSFASTGNANDGLEFILVIVVLLLIILGLLNGVDYLKMNGKTIIYEAITFLKKNIILFRDRLNKANSDYFDLTYL